MIFQTKEVLDDKNLKKFQKLYNANNLVELDFLKLLMGLSKITFNENEINEVLNIIDFAEAKIEAVKVTLNGTNINTDDPTPAMKLALDEIRLLQTKMAVDIRVKINEILAYKNRAK